MAEKMMTKFERYWSVIHDIMGVVIVLDPRYKMALLELLGGGSSEFVFRTSCRILSPHRSRINWNTLEALMCARSWLWPVENVGKVLSY
ncbi:hypothetical protein Lal_00022753 [Lupinus albus]|nr:hypothetical protein Lal_00022753 [Lupinus albus]